MLFKRPQVRYSETPEPVTPYQAAAQVWDQRIGSARVQAKNWRLMAFGCLSLALLMAGGLVWRSAQSIVTPYVVEVAAGGQVRAVGEAATPYKPNDAQIAYHLRAHRPNLDGGGDHQCGSRQRILVPGALDRAQLRERFALGHRALDRHAVRGVAAAAHRRTTAQEPAGNLCQRPVLEP